MADLLETLNNLSAGLSNRSKSDLVDEYHNSLEKELDIVDRLIEQSQKLHKAGKRTEANNLIGIVNEHLANLSKIQRVVSELIKRAP